MNPAETDHPREELRRLVRAARLLVTAEREAGTIEFRGPPAPQTQPRTALPGSATTTATAVEDARPPARPGAHRPPPRPIPATAETPPAKPGPTTPSRPPRPRRKPFVPKVRPLDLPADALAPFGDLPDRVAACTACGLCEGRTLPVFGEGDAQADLVFCGEGPGFEEDRSGRPFVGKAGELLTKMIEAGMHLRREDVFILNAVKCRPPDNRTPLPDEVAACRPLLEEQLRVLAPRVIVALGNPAVQALLGPVGGITRVRGRVFEAFGCKVVPTFHPAYLLRNPAAKREAWEDLKLVLRLLSP